MHTRQLNLQSNTIKDISELLTYREIVATRVMTRQKCAVASDLLASVENEACFKKSEESVLYLTARRRPLCYLRGS